MKTKGAVAAGHETTADAAAEILRAGGNAFDAALAALCAACVAEPVLTSLGGGGFLTARVAAGDTRIYDFFVQTPKQKGTLGELDFYPIIADFGTAQQEFHIGLGSVATPGTVRGLFDIHRELGSVPIREIIEPAIVAAREGIRLNPLQAYIFTIVAPIYLATPEAKAIYASRKDPERLYGAGELLRQPELADTLDNLAREGDRLFYEGDIATEIIRINRTRGGQLNITDLRDFATVRRNPLHRVYRDSRLYFNPPPSTGGLLIAFALAMLQIHDLRRWQFGSPQHLKSLADIMARTNLARNSASLETGLTIHDWTQRYRNAIAGRPLTTRGTTHISVIDSLGNAAALTLSNGEGCGHVVPGTGIMLNNMLGEEDLNPVGFHQWREDVRVASMMAPTIAEDRRRLIALGSGGSNRLRTAILQTLSNIVDFNMAAADAVTAPRIHVEHNRASIEPGFEPPALDAVKRLCPEHHLWRELNLFFGGTHTVTFDGRAFDGAGDPRRGGVTRIVH